MFKTMVLSIGIAAAAIAAPAMAQRLEATQEPGQFGFNYPDTSYTTGSYGVRATPRSGYYYRHHAIGERGALPTWSDGEHVF